LKFRGRAPQYDRGGPGADAKSNSRYARR
jgi:hypothetical protein